MPGPSLDLRRRAPRPYHPRVSTGRLLRDKWANFLFRVFGSIRGGRPAVFTHGISSPRRTVIITGTVVSVTVSDAEAVPDADLVAAQRPDKRSASRFHDMDISSGASQTSTRRHQLAHYVRQRGRWQPCCSGDARTPFPAPPSRALRRDRVYFSGVRYILLRRSGSMRGTMRCR